MLYDIGAATTTTSVLRRAADGGCHVLATAELSDAGGIDIDAAILNHLGEIFAQDAPQDWYRLRYPENLSDRRASWQLLRDIQRAKEALSQSATASVYVPLVDQHVSLDRELLDRLARPILERTTGAVHAALASAGIAAADLAAVFAIGGVSRMPLVTDVLRQALGQPPTAVEQHRLVVAKGAAYLPLPAVPTGSGIARPAGGARHGPAGRGRDARGRRRVPTWTDLRPRHKLVAIATTLVLAGVVAIIFWSQSARSTAGPATSACSYKIAYLGPTSSLPGGSANPRNGVALAVAEYNARNSGCTAELVELVERTQSDAATGARKAASDPKILGVVSRASSAVSHAVPDRASRSWWVTRTTVKPPHAGGLLDQGG